MTPFSVLSAIAAPLRLENVDTDKILPARFLKTITREGLGQALFSTFREDSEFVLNRSPWNSAQILIALENFGCGSSREHAPWSLLDFGIRCIIAPSIADIFYGNCFKNGMLPICLPKETVLSLMSLITLPKSAQMTIDLPKQEIIDCFGRSISFEIGAKRKYDLINGADEISQSLAFEDAIANLERRRKENQPWFESQRETLMHDGLLTT